MISSKNRVFSFTVPASVGDAFEELCTYERRSVVDKLLSLVFKAVEARKGVALGQPKKLNGFPKQLFESIGDSEQFTVRQKAIQLGTSDVTVRYGVRQLLFANFLTSAGPVATGSRFAESYRLSDLGRSQKMIAVETDKTADSLAEQRARAHLFLVSEGLSSAAALELLQEEEMVCHLGGVKMDYSLAFWKERLRTVREAEAAESATESQATEAD